MACDSLLILNHHCATSTNREASVFAITFTTTKQNVLHVRLYTNSNCAPQALGHFHNLFKTFAEAMFANEPNLTQNGKSLSCI